MTACLSSCFTSLTVDLKSLDTTPMEHQAILSVTSNRKGQPAYSLVKLFLAAQYSKATFLQSVCFSKGSPQYVQVSTWAPCHPVNSRNKPTLTLLGVL